jgi:elongation factor Ts
LVEAVANGALFCQDGVLKEELLMVQVGTGNESAGAGSGAGTDTAKRHIGKTVKDVLDDATLAIRENLQIVSADKIVASTNDAIVAGYVHGKVFQESNAGTAAALVELVKKQTCTLSTEQMKQVGERLAMHVVAAKPLYLSQKEVPAQEIEKEKQILMEQMADSGKPADILEKIVDGRMRKYYEEVCLVEQSHMLEEGNPKVSKLLSTLGLDLVTFKLGFIQK